MIPRLRGPAGARDRRAGALVALVALVALASLGIIVGCQTSGPSPTALASPTATIVASDAPSATASPSPSGDDVTVDPTLLSILPREVAGTLMLPAPETATQIALDPSLVSEVEAVAVALAVSDSPSGDEDMVIANVVRLRPDVFDETFFLGWRETYDEAACEPAGGVAGSTEAEIGGRQVFVGTCTNGGFTYHVRYGEDVLVSLTSTGTGRFGEIVMAHLGE